MNWTLARFVNLTLIRMIGIAFALLTFVLEGAVILLVLFTKPISSHILDIALQSIGALLGIVTCILWFWYAPDRITLKRSEQMHSVSKDTSQPPNSIENAPPQLHVLRSSAQSSKQFRDIPAIIMNKNMRISMEDTLQDKHANSFENVPSPMPAEANPAFSKQEHSWPPFIVPKEGNDPNQCADKGAASMGNVHHRFAVTDGASTSFLPAQWAQIIADHFVERQNDFGSQSEFTAWLAACSQKWLRWVDEIWIPQLGRGQDWSRDKAQGAQTTLIGCAFSYQTLQQTGSTIVSVTAVGDSNFFLVRPPLTETPGLARWQQEAFPWNKPEDFGPVPDTLVTAEMFIPHVQYKCTTFTAQKGDYLFLTTDALAKWILVQQSNNINPWLRLLAFFDKNTTNRYEDFRNFVLAERDNGNLETDDTTMLIIHL